MLPSARYALICWLALLALCCGPAHAQTSSDQTNGSSAPGKAVDKASDKATPKAANQAAHPATGSNPAGEWHTYGDGGGSPRAVIRITEAGGVYTGRIVRSLVPGEDPDKLCTKCTDERKDKRMNGMAFLTGMRKVEGGQRYESGSEFSGGEILDPDTGNIYRSTMTLSADGRRLTVRGYIGIPLFGRTQEWRRAD